MRLIRIAAAVLLLGAAGTAAAADDADTFTLNGFVIDQHEASVAGATVSLDGHDGGAVSDSLGNFQLSGVPRGTYDLSARVGCEVFAFQSAIAVPRPMKVPYPVVARRLDIWTHDAPDLSPSDQGKLIREALAAFVQDERRVLADAFLADGVIRIVALNATINELPGDPSVPLVGPNDADDGQIQVDDPIPIQVWLERSDDRVAVHVLRATPSLPDELDFFLADRALIVFELTDDAGWQQLAGYFCLEADSQAVRTSVGDDSTPPPN